MKIVKVICEENLPLDDGTEMPIEYVHAQCEFSDSEVDAMNKFINFYKAEERKHLFKDIIIENKYE